MERVMVTGDDAIELACRDGPGAPGTGGGIGVNLRSFTQERRELPAALRDALVEMAGKLAAPLLPLPIARHAWEDDCVPLSRLMGNGDAGQTIDDPSSLAAQISRCRVVVSGSYHAAVFALSRGIPVVALSAEPYYDDKFAGLAHQFGGGCETVSVADDGDLPALRAAIQKAWESAPMLAEGLRAAAMRQIDASRLAYQRLKQLPATERAGVDQALLA
jgi:colanic acid/amylovoran biosynthesis protein